MQFTGDVVEEGDRVAWVSLEYAAEHKGKECDEAFNTSAFSITNSFGNSVDGTWDGTIQDHGGLVEKREEPPGSGNFVLLSDLVLINSGPDTPDALETPLAEHAPAGTYQLCRLPINPSSETKRGQKPKTVRASRVLV